MRSGRGEVIIRTQHMYDHEYQIPPSFEHLIGTFEDMKDMISLSTRNGTHYHLDPVNRY